ncbi:FtsX-like permease family protein [Opitutus sp. GAS368]|jgi:putative ABC transport system permease protein|uniref:ABC transporter permease n=1 Tax=Opitutus sp. GAS368 TaxID=1882749 RepID=UPI00087A8D81|nr:FtsX-like permease family protein [Opitutus sp. GAS368]SDS32722.1 putative ABC transport system permease protein [Opitutus sp. GAS368]
MTLALIVLRSLRQHLFSTLITAFSIALAGGLLMSVWVVKVQSQATFTQVNAGFDAVLGARGSKLQLVLNAIFHLEASPGNVAFADYEFIKRHPAVKLAVPIAVGDNLRGYRIVGTIPEFFRDVEYAPGKTFALRAGQVFNPDAKEAVLGSFSAEKLGLKVGDIFHPFHGLVYDEKNQHAETYTVTGILASSNTPVDKVIWIPLHGLQTMSGHDPRAATDVSAVLIQLRSPTAGFMLDMMYNKQGNRLTFAYPVGAIMADLFSKISWFDQVLTLVAYLVAFVSAIGVLVAIYNSMAARRRDIAILRALGAGRLMLFSAVVLEATVIGALGMAAAFAVYGLTVAGVAAVIRAQTGILLETWAYNPVMLWAPAGMVLLCGVCGLLPAWKAYRTDVAGNLAPIS